MSIISTLSVSKNPRDQKQNKWRCKYDWLNSCDESVQVPWKGFVADHEPTSQGGQEEQVQGKLGTLSQH